MTIASPPFLSLSQLLSSTPQKKGLSLPPLPLLLLLLLLVVVVKVEEEERPEMDAPLPLRVCAQL